MTAGRVLADTSVWVEYLRLGERGRAAELGEYLRQRRLLTCGPVVAELLAGALPADQESLGTLLAGLPWAELDRAAWRRVGLAASDLRGIGRTLSLTDIVIAVAARVADAVVWSADQDFDHIRQVVTGLGVRPLQEPEQAGP